MREDDTGPDVIAGAAQATTALRLEGRDASDLLHRISTAFLTDLEPGMARATLFCDFRGRLLHRAAVAMTSDRAVWLLRDDAAAGPLAAFLDRHLFREDVRVTDESRGRVVQRVPGPALRWGTLREVDAVPVAVQVSAAWSLEVGLDPAVEPGPAMEEERILSGLPRHGHEIVEDFTPFEVGLAHEVHLSKGCFTGQEALMRLVTYASVRRRLARVGGVGEPPDVPCDVRRAGERVGRLTSAVPRRPPLDPDELGALPAGLGGWVGLAVLKHEACEPGAALEAGGSRLDDIAPIPLTRPLGLP